MKFDKRVREFVSSRMLTAMRKFDNVEGQKQNVVESVNCHFWPWFDDIM